jgi:hypothetical protein
LQRGVCAVEVLAHDSAFVLGTSRNISFKLDIVWLTGSCQKFRAPRSV